MTILDRGRVHPTKSCLSLFVFAEMSVDAVTGMVPPAQQWCGRSPLVPVRQRQRQVGIIRPCTPRPPSLQGWHARVSAAVVRRLELLYVGGGARAAAHAGRDCAGGGAIAHSRAPRAVPLRNAGVGRVR